MTSESERALLNEHQRRHFEVLLARLEDALVQVERLAARDPEGSRRLTLYREDLPAGFVDAIRPALGRARELIAGLADDLRLQPRMASRARSIRALLTAGIVRVEDSGAPNLRGYGYVDPRVAHEIEPALDELRATLASVLRHLEVGRDPPGPTPSTPAKEEQE